MALANKTLAHVTAVSLTANWTPVCRVSDILPESGVCALVDGRQIAVFRSHGRLYATGNTDPFAKAQVLSRGLVGDAAGVPKITSPLTKRSFSLVTGECLDSSSVRIPLYAVRRCDDVVEVSSSPYP